jgi:hypothetical protein
MTRGRHPHGFARQGGKQVAAALAVQALVPLADCPKCGKRAIVELTPAQRLAQPDDTTHVCHPGLGGCNHGFTDDRTREPESKAAYGWIIDRETVSNENDESTAPEHRTKSRAGWVGPRDIGPEVEQRLRNGEGEQFRMYDDDGELYYEGRYIGPNDETAFGPLTDLGTPDAGAVRIDYNEGGKWVTL